MTSIPAPGRQRNEDRFLFLPPGLPAVEMTEIGYLFLVADGVSQGGRGAQAAQLTVDNVEQIANEQRAIALRPSLLEMKLSTANEQVHERKAGRCAATGVWIWEENDDRGSLYAGWSHVGDTRLYHYTLGEWKCRTTDHASGSVLLRAIGDGPGLIVEFGRLGLQSGDWLMLVSDGIYKYASPAVSGLLDDCATAVDAVEILATQARVNGSPDDATVIVVRVS